MIRYHDFKDRIRSGSGLIYDLIRIGRSFLKLSYNFARDCPTQLWIGYGRLRVQIRVFKPCTVSPPQGDLYLCTTLW